MAALALVLIACYGTLVAVSLLPFIDLTLAVDESVWAGAIILFTGMTVVAVAAGIRKHRSFMPLVLAMVGAGLQATRCSDSSIVSSSSLASHWLLALLFGTFICAMRVPAGFGAVLQQADTLNCRKDRKGAKVWASPSPWPYKDRRISNGGRARDLSPDLQA